MSLNGVEVYPFKSETELLDYIDMRKGILVAINAEKVLHATEHTRNIINNNVGFCDGAGPLMALKQKGYKDAFKMPGCELWLKIVERFHKDKSFYLVGTRHEIITEAVSKLREEYPGINILGFHDGFLTTDEIKQGVIDDICAKKPDIVLVAMGSPKQEIFMEELLRHHKAIYQGLGGSFDVYTGYVERAPRWWIDHNLEFAYRLLKQPSRIKRQIHLVRFAWWLLFRKL